jgi:integrating conjugative element protein (TIGR03761 family)
MSSSDVKPAAPASAGPKAGVSRLKSSTSASALAATRPSMMAAGTAATSSLSPLMCSDSQFAAPTDFEKEANSPFSDGYSISGEKQALAQLLASDDPDESDPLYPRLMLLEQRQRDLEQRQTSWNARLGADALVSPQEASSMRQLGALVDDEADTMVLHTKEAYRLFMGRARDPEGKTPQIVGGKRIASALKSLWMLTGLDNPYADWALVHHEQTLREMSERLNREIKAGQAHMDEMRKRGLSYGLLVSREPKSLSLGFKSPYGYAVAELVVSYDYFIRVQKTLGRKNVCSDDQVRQSIRELTRFIRRCLNETARFERWLLRPELRELSRGDFIVGASADGTKRVTALTEILGPVPAEIFAGKLQPRHSRRRTQLTEQDRALLQQVSQQLAEAEAGDAAADAVDPEAEARDLAQLV